MLRTNAVVRPTLHEGRKVLDIFHVWPDQHVENGVKHRSWLHVYLSAEPPIDPKTGQRKTVRVQLWAPGGIAGEAKDLRWGEEWFIPSGGWGIASVVAEDDHPLAFFWELTPGKA